MIFGVDISSFQGAGIPDNKHGRGAPQFVIINVRDPGLGDKARECIRRGTPWAIYTWAFPGANQRDNLRWSALTVENAGLDWRSIRYWIDYEDSGVSAQQIVTFYDAAAELGVEAGLYTYLFLMPSIPDAVVAMRPLWLAYYPGANNGVYPANQDGAARQRGAVLWQFSSNATNPPGLDENAVMDEAWFANEWAGGAPPPEEITEEDMYVGWGTAGDGTVYTAVVDGGITTLPFGGALSDYGFYQDGYDYAQSNKLPFRLLTPGQIDFANLRNYNERNPGNGGGGGSAPVVYDFTGVGTPRV